MNPPTPNSLAHTEFGQNETEIPLHTIELDYRAFSRLSSRERDIFYYYAEQLERLGYFSRRGRPAQEWAFIDFSEYRTFADYVARCRRIHTGNAVRDAMQAERLGYYSKFFNPRVFVGDIVAVNTSSPERQGSPMSKHYFLSVEERGGYSTSLQPEVPPEQPFIWVHHWGIFKEKPGHRQGDLIVNEQLLAYCILRRCSQFIQYTTFIGHHEYLRDGIMYKMNLDLVQKILEYMTDPADEASRYFAGNRFLFYARYFTAGKGLQMWKKRMLFRPGFFQFDYPDPKVVTPSR